MLAVLCIWLLTSIIALSIGAMLLHALEALGWLRATNRTCAVELFFAGLCVWGALLNIWSLLGAVHMEALAVTMCVCILYILYHFKHWQQNILYPFGQALYGRSYGWLSALLVLGLLCCAAIPPNNYDSGLYHLSAIRWIEQYAALPGLGNLHGRFAFNPAIFAVHAALNGRQLLGSPVFALNSLLLLVFSLWLLRQILATTEFARLWVYTAILVVCWREYVMQVSSPTPDICGTILSCFLLLRVEARQRAAVVGGYADALYWGDYLLLFILVMYAFCTKLSTAPLLLLLPYWLWVCWGSLSRRAWAILGLFGLLIVLPWVGRNIILSGYVIYPLPID